MLNTLFQSVTQSALSPGTVIACTAASLIMGVCIALFYQFRCTYTRSFVFTLALLPALVQIVIMLVNGNLGAGVAVAGAFSLVRFRSVPGSAREIGFIFFAMAIGLATGMGYLGYAVLFLLLVGAAILAFTVSGLGAPRTEQRELKITIPESLDYEGVFDDLLARYTSRAELVSVKTTNMGSLYELHYTVSMHGGVIPKEFLDGLRCRNGNLNIVCGRLPAGRDEL